MHDKNTILSALALICSLHGCHDADDAQLEACEGHPCYDKGACYQTSAHKYDIARGCRLGVEEVSCLEDAILINIVNEEYRYSIMSRAGDDKHCWLFDDTAIPVDKNWSEDTTSWCENIVQFPVDDCQ